MKKYATRLDTSFKNEFGTGKDVFRESQANPDMSASIIVMLQHDGNYRGCIVSKKRQQNRLIKKDKPV